MTMYRYFHTIRTVHFCCQKVCSTTQINVIIGQSRSFNTCMTLLGTTPGQFKMSQMEKSKKAQKITKYIHLAKGAKISGGSADPSNNKVLAELLEKANKDGVSKSTILKTLADQPFENEIEYLLTAPGGLAVVVDCKTSKSQAYGKFKLQSVLKQSLFPATIVDRSQISKYFTRQGVIIVPQPFEDGKSLSEEESTDLAIDIEAEDVTPTKDGLKFICSEKTFKIVENSLLERDIPISYSYIEYVALNEAANYEDHLQFFEYFCTVIQKKDQLSAIHVDFNILATNFSKDS